MFVLDGLRRIQGSRIFIPQFHLGHLGFIPDLEVYCRTGRLDDRGSQELTLTPFQGHRNELFLLKCVFQDQVGVVQKALSAFASLKMNILSLESATINGGEKHVLFCILSWSTTKYTAPVPLDEGAQHKFVSLLPLLPTADARYLLLLETLFLFCGDALDHEEVAGQRLLPRVHMRLFDAFQETEGTWNPVKVQVQRQKKPKTTRVFFNLEKMIGGLTKSATNQTDVILLSETETKTLRLMFPGPRRNGKLLHIAFHHVSRPGALLAIARLLSNLGFNILTSLLRKGDHENNVWETMLEFADDSKKLQKPASISAGRAGVDWFREWAFNEYNRKNRGTGALIKYMIGYNVRVSRPSYPRSTGASESDFAASDILEYLDSHHRTAPEDMRVTRTEFDARINELERMEASTAWGWLASLTREDLRRRCAHQPHKGLVFLSLPSTCRAHHDIIKERFRSELQLTVDSYIDQNSEDVAATALAKIRRADFFFALWHPDRNRPDNVSPWMPFEYGAARSLGKKRIMLFHADLSVDVKRRLDPSMSWMEYDDLSFREKLDKVIEYCRQNWLTSAWDELSIEIKDQPPPARKGARQTEADLSV